MTTVLQPGARERTTAMEGGPRRETILVATDGTARASAALHLALGLADRGADVHALCVVDFRPAPAPPPLDTAMTLADAAFGDTFREERERGLRAHLADTLGRAVDWPLHTVLGTPWHAIVTHADEVQADFIVLGLRRHHTVERLTGDETSLHVMQTATCPVIAVAAASESLPRRVLVGVDFSRSSLAAARAADRLVGSNGTLVLAYTQPPERYVDDDGERVIRELGEKAAFDWFRGELARADNAPTEEVRLPRESGVSAASALLQHAHANGVDMIALGARRHGRIERWILGSVTTDVARSGGISMLVVPPGDRATP